jgi:type 1 glutamine amidotransferase
MKLRALVALLTLAFLGSFAHARTTDGRTKIVLIAGTKSHGPGFHEYLKSVRLLKMMLDRSASLHNVVTEVYYDGWPVDQATLETADTIVFFTDGMQWSPWAWSPERIAFMQRQIDRGCGFMTFHFATYIPYKFAQQALDWDGGYIDYDGPKHPTPYFTQKTLTTDVVFPNSAHPVMNGVHPFRIHEEFYYKPTFVNGMKGVTPLLRATDLPSDPKVFPGPLATPLEQTFVWAYDRPKQRGTKVQGRSIGATFGHYYTNWQMEDYRKLIVNAICWTAHLPIPADGIQTTWIDDNVVDQVLGFTPVPNMSPLEPTRQPVDPAYLKK